MSITPPDTQFTPLTPPDTQPTAFPIMTGPTAPPPPTIAATTTTSTTTTTPPHRAWWKESSVYQIYPSSFLSSPDASIPGVGDVKGIISKLDYLSSLGVDVIWVCPIYESPQVDMGYDISDYKAIDGRYGSLEDVDELIKGCHDRGMKLLMDLVVNHTSDQHAWFKDESKRDWYIWKKGKTVDGGKRLPPNNWSSCFGGSAWTYDEGRDEYYLHLFAKEQPDLNWENPKVVEAVHDVIRFWLERGVDGFRMDVINLISKDQDYPDVIPNDTTPSRGKDPISGIELYDGGDFFANGPRLHEHLQGIGKILKEYNAFSVGEMPWVRDESEVLKAVGQDRDELNMIFHFEIVDMDAGPQGKYSPKPFSLPTLKDITNKWQKFMYENGGWNALYLENHDQSRTVSRFCGIDDDGNSTLEERYKACSMLATYLGGQAGTLFVYQGQELGMGNVPAPPAWDIQNYRDLEVLNHWKYYSSVYADSPEMLSQLKAEYRKKSRDNARTPMQWDSSSSTAGFCPEGVVPWIDVKPEYKFVNAAAQISDENSAWSYWKKLLKLRKEHVDELVYGDYATCGGEEMEKDEEVLAYTRSYNNNGEKRVLVVCNWSNTASTRKLGLFGDNNVEGGKISLGNYSEELQIQGDEIVLRPFEAFVMQL